MKYNHAPTSGRLVVNTTVPIGSGGSSATTASGAVAALGGFEVANIGKPNNPIDLDANLKIPKERFMMEPEVTIMALQDFYKAGIEAAFMITNFSDKRDYTVTPITGTIRRVHDMIFWKPTDNVDNGFVVNGKRYYIPVTSLQLLRPKPEIIYSNVNEGRPNTRIVYSRADPGSYSLSAAAIEPDMINVLSIPGQAKGYYLVDPKIDRWSAGGSIWHRYGSYMDADLLKQTGNYSRMGGEGMGKIFDLPDIPTADHNLSVFLDSNGNSYIQNRLQLVWFGGVNDHVATDWTFVYTSGGWGSPLKRHTVAVTGDTVDLCEKEVVSSVEIEGELYELSTYDSFVTYHFADGSSISSK